MKSKYYGYIEILHQDGSSDSLYAGAGLFEKISEEIIKGECLIHIPCRSRKSIEFFSGTVKKVSLIIGGRILKQGVAVD